MIEQFTTKLYFDVLNGLTLVVSYHNVSHLEMWILENITPTVLTIRGLHMSTIQINIWLNQFSGAVLNGGIGLFPRKVLLCTPQFFLIRYKSSPLPFIVYGTFAKTWSFSHSVSSTTLLLLLYPKKLMNRGMINRLTSFLLLSYNATVVSYNCEQVWPATNSINKIISLLPTTHNFPLPQQFLKHKYKQPKFSKNNAPGSTISPWIASTIFLVTFHESQNKPGKLVGHAYLLTNYKTVRQESKGRHDKCTQLHWILFARISR